MIEYLQTRFKVSGNVLLVMHSMLWNELGFTVSEEDKKSAL